MSSCTLGHTYRALLTGHCQFLAACSVCGGEPKLHAFYIHSITSHTEVSPPLLKLLWEIMRAAKQVIGLYIQQQAVLNHVPW